MPEKCDGSEPSTWQVTGSVSGFSTQIVFDGMRVAVEQLATTATVGNFASPRLGWSASAGGILAGRIEGRDVSGGGTVSGTLSWLPVYERPARPFVAFTATLGASFARALGDDEMRHSWWAFDLRAGAMVGKTLWDRVVPYAAVRVFGGPVLWTLAGADVVGGDRYHVTVGAGLVVRLPRDADLSAEVMPLGERSASLGFTWRL